MGAKLAEGGGEVRGISGALAGVAARAVAEAQRSRVLPVEVQAVGYDYDLGKPSPTPELRSMELGPRDRLSQAFVHEVETTPHPHPRWVCCG